MILQIYTLVFSLALLLLSPLWLPVALLWPRFRQGLPQRFGRLPRRIREFMYVGERSLWVHAASLGEVNAIAMALRSLLDRLGGVPLVFTCTTPAGVEQARKLFPEGVAHLLLPLDLPVFLKPLILRYKPAFAIVAETELWPNFLHLLRQSKCEIMLMNGRMSSRSYGRYAKLRALFSSAILCMDVLAIQSEEDAARFVALGAKPSRVVVTGNTKFDVLEGAKLEKKRGEAVREALGLQQGGALIVAGSSRPGEEDIFLAAFKALKGRVKGLRLLIAPRHLQRLSAVEGMIKKAGLDFTRRSAGKAEAEVILLDTLGELSAVYSFATLAWIGGSWRAFGGQNPLEAAAHGIPVLFGPDMRHFKEPARILLEGGAARQVEAGDLAEASQVLLKDSAQAAAMGEAALRVMRKSSGASRRSADLAWKMAVLARARELERDWRSRSAFASLKPSVFGKKARAEP